VKHSSATIFLSVVVPLYNEESGLREFHNKLVSTASSVGDGNYEIIYCDDGSTDNTPAIVAELHAKDEKTKLLSLSRNFGKEIALAAGIAEAHGKAIITIDGDGQHPVEKIPEFIKKWQKGAKVVVGIRVSNNNEGPVKRYGSRLFYLLFNSLSGQHLVPGSSDFRLIDQDVQRQLVKLTEPDRITRGLIDWLGFRRDYIDFKANPRLAGKASYSTNKLLRLATHSFISLSPKPLYFFGYLGIFITATSLLLGLTVFIEQILLRDPLLWEFTGTAMLSIMLLFMTGIILMSQGILALYVSQVHNQTKGRPLYIVDTSRSIGLENKEAPSA
jgi:polyisoprenyl-phosphate glycosyltransferase